MSLKIYFITRKIKKNYHLIDQSIPDRCIDREVNICIFHNKYIWASNFHSRVISIALDHIHTYSHIMVKTKANEKTKWNNNKKRNKTPFHSSVWCCVFVSMLISCVKSIDIQAVKTWSTTKGRSEVKKKKFRVTAKSFFTKRKKNQKIPLKTFNVRPNIVFNEI